MVSPEALATIRISGLAVFGAMGFAAEALVAVVLDAAAGLIGIGEMGVAINRSNPNQEPTGWCIPRRIHTKQLDQLPNARFESFKNRSGRNGTGSLSLVLSTVFTNRTLSRKTRGRTGDQIQG
jgi:hypothetical protein